MPITNNKDLRKLVLRLVSKYSKNNQHLFSVEDISLKILDSLSNILVSNPLERELLSHASLLHDIGSYINEKKHHEHTKYIIDYEEILAHYPADEKILLSLITYNHRKKIHDSVRLLPKKDKELVLRLSSILRLADSLDFSKEKVIVKEVKIQNSEIKIFIDGIIPEKLNDRLLKKKTLFCKIFMLDFCLET